MFNLMLELSLVFLIAALIGWLMGRYLCKSGEYEQRDQNKQLSKANHLVQTQLDDKDKAYQATLLKINQSETQLAESQQQLSALNAKLASMTEERDGHLIQLQESSQCESKFATLLEDYTIEKQQLRKLKDKNRELQNQIEQLINEGNKKEKHIIAQDKKIQTRTLELGNTTKAYEEQAEELAKLQEIEAQQDYILAENQQLLSRFKLVDDENKSLKLRIEQNNQEFSQLQEKCSELSENSLGFGKKLTALNDEKNHLNRIIEAMTIEKNDYLGRLRAISSVVDVVGTEVVEDTV